MTFDSLQKFYDFSNAKEVNYSNYLSLPLEYYNPTGKKNDCVVRAISKAFDVDPETIRGCLIDAEGDYNGKYSYIEKEVYGEYLEKLCKAKRIDVKQEEQLDGYNLLKSFNKGTIIVRVDKHIYCAIDGIAYDCWNPLGEKVINIWLIPSDYFNEEVETYVY